MQGILEKFDLRGDNNVTPLPLGERARVRGDLLIIAWCFWQDWGKFAGIQQGLYGGCPLFARPPSPPRALEGIAFCDTKNSPS